MAEITSAYEALGELSWDEVHDATDLLTLAVDERTADSKVRQLIFQEETTTDLAVAWRQDVPAGSHDEIERLAEFAEAPVIDPTKAAEMLDKIDAYGVAARVSYEQTKNAGGRAVQREVNHLTRTIQMDDSAKGRAAINKAVGETDPLKKIETLAFTTPVTDPTADVLGQINQANELIMSANVDGIQFGYVGNLLWLNPVTAARIRNHANIRDLYIGNMASENPMFKGDLASIAGQFQILEDPALPLEEGYLLQAGDVSGASIGSEFVWADGRPYLSSFYPDGEPVRGGRTRSFRADYSKWHALGIRAPKAIVKLAGLV